MTLQCVTPRVAHGTREPFVLGESVTSPSTRDNTEASGSLHVLRTWVQMLTFLTCIETPPGIPSAECHRDEAWIQFSKGLNNRPSPFRLDDSSTRGRILHHSIGLCRTYSRQPPLRSLRRLQRVRQRLRSRICQELQ